jgi:hypothetical protein
MAPTRIPAGSQGQIQKQRPASLLFQAWDLIVALLFDRTYYFHLVGLLLLGELALGLLVIRYIPCESPNQSFNRIARSFEFIHINIPAYGR